MEKSSYWPWLASPPSLGGLCWGGQFTTPTKNRNTKSVGWIVHSTCVTKKWTHKKAKKQRRQHDRARPTANRHSPTQIENDENLGTGATMKEFHVRPSSFFFLEHFSPIAQTRGPKIEVFFPQAKPDIQTPFTFHSSGRPPTSI